MKSNDIAREVLVPLGFTEEWSGCQQTAPLYHVAGHERYFIVIHGDEIEIREYINGFDHHSVTFVASNEDEFRRRLTAAATFVRPESIAGLTISHKPA